MSDDSSATFDDIVNAQNEIDERRRKLERGIFTAVIILAIMGFGTAALNSSTVETIVSWFSPSGGHNGTIIFLYPENGNNLSQISRQSTPTFNNTFVRMNVSFSDSDLNDWHMLYVCNTTSSNYTLVSNSMVFNFTCGGRYQLCNSSNRLMSTDNPLYCDSYISRFGNQTQNFTAFIIDSGGKVVGMNSTFAGDRPPYIISMGVMKL